MKNNPLLSWGRSHLVFAFLIVIGLLLGTAGLSLRTARAQTTNLALNKPVTCSPTPQFPCAQAVDGNTGTRWASAQGVDPQWIYVDLGATSTISSVILRWEAAYATAFQIQTSPDARCRHLDQHLQHDHRHRRRADAHRLRLRSLCAHEWHRPRYDLRLFAVGVRSLRHRRRRDEYPNRYQYSCGDHQYPHPHQYGCGDHQYPDAHKHSRGDHQYPHPDEYTDNSSGRLRHDQHCAQ